MNEFNERIREFIDDGVKPVSVDEIYLARGGATTENATHLVQRRRRRRRIVLSGVAALVIALAGAGLVTLPGSKNIPAPAAPAATFLEAAAHTATRERPLVSASGQYLYVATLISMSDGTGMHPSPTTFWYVANELVQTWTSPQRPGHQTYRVVGRPLFVSAAARAIGVTYGSKPLGSGQSAGPPPYYDVVGLPTRSSALLAYFKDQPDLPAKSSYESEATWEFETALGFLQNGASSTQRAALLKFIAAIPGVRLLGHASSVATDKSGSVIALRLGGAGRTEEAIVDLVTSNLIEVRVVLTSLPAEASPTIGPAPYVGEIVSYSDFVFAGVTRGHVQFSLPAGTPTFPKVWPFGSLREPLPGWPKPAST